MHYKLNLLFTLLFCSLLYGYSENNIQLSKTFKGTVLYDSKKGDENLSDSIIRINFNTENTTNQKTYYYISIINPVLNKIEIDELDSTYLLGDKEKFADRIFYHSNFVFPVVLQPKEKKHFEIRIFPQAENLQVKATLLPENEFIKFSNHDNFFTGVFFGISFMFILLLISFYIYSKSKFFIYYLFITVFQILLFIYYSGIGFHRIWAYSNFIQQYLCIPLFVGYFIFHIEFIRFFFVAELRKQIYKKLFRVLIICSLFAAFIFIYINYHFYYKKDFFSIAYTLLQFAIVCYILVIFLLCFLSYRDSKQAQILWILIGSFIHYLSWIFFLNNIYGSSAILNHINAWMLIPGNQFISNISFILFTLEIFIISFFIVYNYHFLIRQNILSYKRLLFLQKKNINTFILGQENEREKITEIIQSELVLPIQQLNQDLTNWEKSYRHSDKLLSKIHQEMEIVLRDIHHITTNYVTPDLERMPLHELVYTACDKLTENHELHIESELPLSYSLNAVANVQLYRIFQELSNNILKHAEADEVFIRYYNQDQSLVFIIKDNGLGFQEEAKHGLGLLNIQSRLDTMNGSMHIQSVKENTGTHIILILPLSDIR